MNRQVEVDAMERPPESFVQPPMMRTRDVAATHPLHGGFLMAVGRSPPPFAFLLRHQLWLDLFDPSRGTAGRSPEGRVNSSAQSLTPEGAMVAFPSRPCNYGDVMAETEGY